MVEFAAAVTTPPCEEDEDSLLKLRAGLDDPLFIQFVLIPMRRTDSPPAKLRGDEVEESAETLTVFTDRSSGDSRRTIPVPPPPPPLVLMTLSLVVGGGPPFMEALLLTKLLTPEPGLGGAINKVLLGLGCGDLTMRELELLLILEELVECCSL